MVLETVIEGGFKYLFNENDMKIKT